MDSATNVFPDLVPERQNPLDIPEIRIRVSLFLQVNDLLNCVMVNKAWLKDFIYPVWHTVQFQSGLRELPQEVLVRYGHHVRTVLNVTSIDDLQLLQRAHCINIRNITIEFDETEGFPQQCYAFIQSQMDHITDLDICAVDTSRHELIASEDNKVPTGLFWGSISKDMFSTSLRPITGLPLKNLYLEHFWMTRGQFSDLLKSCPNLFYLWIKNFVLLEETSSSSLDSTTGKAFQHPGLKELGATVEEALRPNPSTPDAPSLFSHFPNLTYWRTLSGENDVTRRLARELGTELRLCCPLLTEFDFHHASFEEVEYLLTFGFEKMTVCELLFRLLNLGGITALLMHQKSLLRLKLYVGYHFLYNTIEPAEVLSHLEGYGRAIQLLPQYCSNLVSLSIPGFEMEMDHILEGEWACKGIENLWIRIKGLDTREMIDETVHRWAEASMAREAKRKDKKDVDLDAITEQVNGLSVGSSLVGGRLGRLSDDDNGPASSGNGGDVWESLQDKVVRHLLQFKSLQLVWLGTKEVLV